MTRPLPLVLPLGIPAPHPLLQPRHLSHGIYTADDVAEARRDLALLRRQHAEENDPAARDMLADWIATDEAWLAEMIEMVRRDGT